MTNDVLKGVLCKRRGKWVWVWVFLVLGVCGISGADGTADLRSAAGHISVDETLGDLDGMRSRGRVHEECFHPKLGRRLRNAFSLSAGHISHCGRESGSD